MPYLHVSGLPWFRREDWPRWRAIDATLPQDYDQWLSCYEEVLLNFERIGGRFAEVIMDPDVFLAWVSAMGITADRRAMSRYADMRASRR